MNFINSTFISLVLPSLFVIGSAAAGTEFPLSDDAGRKIFAASSSRNNPVPAVPETIEPEAPPTFDLENPQAKGIILSFYHWPDEEEKTLILEKTTAAGLKKTIELTRFKSWIFAWLEWKNAIKALEVCNSLTDISSLDYCEPDYLLGPATDLTRQVRQLISRKRDRF